LRELAPLVAIFGGYALGAAVAFAMGLPMRGVFATPIIIGCGAMIGIIAAFRLSVAKYSPTRERIDFTKQTKPSGNED
jgi:hypothetical protein